MDIQVKVGVVVTDADDRVLLIKEKLETKPCALWNIIKGSHESGETMEATALRECQEEAGIQVEMKSFLGVYVSEESEKMRIQFNFLTYAIETSARLADKAEQETRDEAIEEARWFTREEIQKMSLEEFVSARSYEVLQDWMSGQSFPLSVCKQVRM
jgi:ADP-ribose pyrophosphatase YjhB (NUDIX family)